MSEAHIRGIVQSHAARNSEFRARAANAAKAGALAALERLIEKALFEAGVRALDFTRATVHNIAEWIRANW
ncbi:hypothetical protein FNQ90_14750 [Streptomyces alkaliphilus]|uniref:Uncharacterized protein n=1 Tax=Streptomyces alkaliphilus TaxID=1472722 RepID=A0A7W3TF12_9ACTN|nr:hypothetical protein [Streptomyces alkaliphilus]MBB0245325.1 hypothetical protein [Streptomyces alkaliphilus]